MTKEQIIEDISKIEVKTEAGIKTIGQVTKYWHREAIANRVLDLIKESIWDYKRIYFCECYRSINKNNTRV